MNTITTLKTRVTSIDLLRGIVMIIMALDHTRDYFHAYSFYYSPTDLAHTSPAIFFTRLITHFCAPVFVFLAGTSAFLSGQNKSKKDLSLFLLKRGLWLIILEITVVCFGWFFNPLFSVQGLQVIWVLGLCMIVLAVLIHFPKTIIFIIGITMVASHNLLDPIHVPGNNLAGFGWSVLHEFNVFSFAGINIYAAYPIIPWVGVMGLGYCFGSLYKHGFDASKRKRILVWTGVTTILLFLIIRYINVYGDPGKWSVQRSTLYTFLSFFNTHKYPPSLLYLLMTLGPSMLFLAITEKPLNRFTSFISTYGRVPLFFYLVHIYILHLLGMLAAVLTGFKWTDMVIQDTWITESPALKGYGFGLPVVYLVWIAVVILLYPLCRWYDNYKLRHRTKWWLSYL